MREIQSRAFYQQWGPEIEPTVRCKHGPSFGCLACGITDRRDEMHRVRRAATPPRAAARRPKRSRDSRRRDRRATIR